MKKNSRSLSQNNEDEKKYSNAVGLQNKRKALEQLVRLLLVEIILDVIESLGMSALSVVVEP